MMLERKYDDGRIRRKETWGNGKVQETLLMNMKQRKETNNDTAEMLGI